MTEMNWKLNNTNDLIAVRRAAIITSRIENVSGCQSIPYSKLSSYTSIHMRINDVQINLKHSPLLQYSVYISVYLFFISARQTIKKKIKYRNENEHSNGHWLMRRTTIGKVVHSTVNCTRFKNVVLHSYVRHGERICIIRLSNFQNKTKKMK